MITHEFPLTVQSCLRQLLHEALLSAVQGDDVPQSLIDVVEGAPVDTCLAALAEVLPRP